MYYLTVRVIKRVKCLLIDYKIRWVKTIQGRKRDKESDKESDRIELNKICNYRGYRQGKGRCIILPVLVRQEVNFIEKNDERLTFFHWNS